MHTLYQDVQVSIKLESRSSFFKFLFEMTILVNYNTLKVCFCVINLKTITYTESDITLFTFKSEI